MGIPIRHLVCASNSNNILTDFLTKGSYEPAHYNLKVGLITGAHQIKSSGASVAQSVERRTIEVEVRGSKPALGTGGGVGSHLTSLIRRALRRRRPHHSTSGDSKFPLMGLIQLAKKKKFGKGGYRLSSSSMINLNMVNPHFLFFFLNKEEMIYTL